MKKAIPAVRLAAAVTAAILFLSVRTAPLLAQPITQIIDSTGDGTNGLDGPVGIAVDSDENVYVTGAGSDNAFKITPNGTVTQIIDYTGDGTNGLADAGGVAVDSADNVYVTGLDSNNAFKITPGGAKTQIIDGTYGLDYPKGVAVDSADNVYVTGTMSGNVFKITPDGTITQIIDATDGLGPPQGIAVDSADNVYVAGGGSGNVFKIAPDGTITEIIDSSGDGYSLIFANGVAVARADNVYVTGHCYSPSPDLALGGCSFAIAPSGVITHIIDGGGTKGLDFQGVAVDSADNVYVAGSPFEYNGALAAAQSSPRSRADDPFPGVFKITPGGTITQIIDPSGDGMSGLDGPSGVAVDSADNVYVAGSGSNNVFKIAATRIVGTGTPESCTEAALDAALAGGGLVTFDCGAEPVMITVTAEKVITAETGETTVNGGGLVTLSGGGTTRIFNLDEDGSLEVRNLTIAHGSGNQNSGGGIANAGTLTVNNCTFSENAGGGVYTSDGGGIGNTGTLTVNNSTFSNNTAGGGMGGMGSAGGGILNDGTLRVSNSTFSDNTADSGGGILNYNGTLAVTNSTFSDNSGGGIDNFLGTLTVNNCTFSDNTAAGGGGIFNLGGTLTVTNSTFSDNTADTADGGGILNMRHNDNDGTLTVTNTIIANNSGGDCVNSSGTITDGGHNLIEDAENACDLADGVNGNIVGIDPMLDPKGLQDNGGPTETIALLPDSPAIDAGKPEVCANPPVNGLDQRGYVRPGRGSTTCSIGAYEFDSPGPPPCSGDCDANGKVEIHELITLVNIALGLADVSRCEAGDRDLDGDISIDEIIAAVGYDLNGCPLDPVARACIDSGGELTTSFCCLATDDFPDMCAVGACGCAPEDSHEVRICDCGAGMCFDGSECVEE